TIIALMLLWRVDWGIGRHLYGFTVYSLLIAVLLVQLMLLHRNGLWAWLESVPMRFLGTISYPVYLYHQWWLGLGAWIRGVPHEVQFLAGVGFSLAGAIGSYYIVERPFLRLKSRFASGHSPVRKFAAVGNFG